MALTSSAELCMTFLPFIFARCVASFAIRRIGRKIARAILRGQSSARATQWRRERQLIEFPWRLIRAGCLLPKVAAQYSHEKHARYLDTTVFYLKMRRVILTARRAPAGRGEAATAWRSSETPLRPFTPRQRLGAVDNAGAASLPSDKTAVKKNYPRRSSRRARDAGVSKGGHGVNALVSALGRPSRRCLRRLLGIGSKILSFARSP
jgi:hypothetical protein